jgi:hypothetical protein
MASSQRVKPNGSVAPFFASWTVFVAPPEEPSRSRPPPPLNAEKSVT